MILEGLRKEDSERVSAKATGNLVVEGYRDIQHAGSHRT